MNTSRTSAGPHDDSWHYLESRDEKHEGNYIEWKYFNFTQKDLSGYIIYYVLDPEHKSNIGGARLLVRILKDGQSYGLIKKIEMSEVMLDTVSASMRMGAAKIVEHDSYHYEIDCNSSDVSWNLHYKQEAPSVDAFSNIHTGLLRWEKVSWLIKMPKANVRGDIRIGQDTFHIDGLGYSDTNWGEMLPFFSRYEWGQYNDESVSLVFGVLFGLDKIKSTYFYLIMGEHLIKLESDTCELEHTKWQEDKIIGIKIPSESTFAFKNEEYEIKFSTKLLLADSPGIKVHPLLPNVVVSEQIVEYEGNIKKNGEIIHKFKGRGFEEWSGKTWRDVGAPF